MIYLNTGSVNNFFAGSEIIKPSPVKPFSGLREKLENIRDFFSFLPQKEAVKSVDHNFSFVESNSSAPINNRTKVLIIGDSQTYGNYGTKLDELVRGTGAKTLTFASWGSSPGWWFSGTESAHVWSKGLDGKESRLHHQSTPLIQEILQKEKPDVVIVTMGGNMISGATETSVTNSVNKIGKAISESGAKLYWAGPPKYDPNKRTPEQLDNFYGLLAKSVSSYGQLIDSRKFIEQYYGNDGLHYSGKKGNIQTNSWATGVFNEIQANK